MIKRHRLLLILCGFIFAAGLALGPGGWLPHAYANVTLVSFTAVSLPGGPDIRIEWETATEFDTVGFFLARSDSSSGPFTRISPFIQNEGDSVVGAAYDFTDGTTESNQTYYYRLEVINTDQTIDYHGPITATAGAPAATPTLTRTPTFTTTPTRTPTPTATPTAQTDTEDAEPSTASDSRTVATPRVATGATITPRSTSASGASNPVVFAATPNLASGADDSQLPAPVDTPVPLVSDASLAATAVPPPAAWNAAQPPAPALAAAEETPAVVAPVVVATEAAPPAAAANSTYDGALILIAAAILFLGIALVILRQARQ